jgi:Bacteriophage probable baseplate hub protein
MASTSTLASGLPSGDYYAPDYHISVDHQVLDAESKGDVLDLKVTMDLHDLTHFDITVNNWNDKTLSFKYSDSTTFDLGNLVRVEMGYAGQLLSMVNGLITSLTPRFPESGPPTLAIAGQDSLVKLKERKPKDGEQKKFVNQLDSEIVQAIAVRNGLVPKITATTERHDIVIQKNQDDLAFLKERAARNDYDCFIGVDPDTGNDALYFQPPTDGRNSSNLNMYVFEWGKSLINFNPTISLNRQVGQVTVKAWDSNTKSTFKYTASASDLPSSGSGENGPSAVSTRFQDRQDIVVDQVVTSQEEAKTLAIALLRERAYSYITATGQVIGLPDLRPGNQVQIKGVGKRFCGKYYVTKVEHALGSSGYLTTFTVRNYDDGGTTS